MFLFCLFVTIFQSTSFVILLQFLSLLFQFFKSPTYNKLASLPTFAISAIIHEYLLWGPFRFVLPVLLVQFGSFGGRQHCTLHLYIFIFQYFKVSNAFQCVYYMQTQHCPTYSLVRQYPAWNYIKLQRYLSIKPVHLHDMYLEHVHA